MNSVGFNGGSAPPSINVGLLWLLGPIGYSKFHAIVSLLILGLGAWYFFRQLRLTALACILGGLAAMLNATFFSVACWGVAAHDITAGMSFLALAMLADPSSRQRWRRVILAGLAVGMGVTEGADVGAIFSLCVAAFILCQAWMADGSRGKNLVAGVGRLILVAVCAAFLAAQSIYGLVTTSIKGVAGTGQDSATRAQHWDWATQWSLPKSEALNLVVPGLFGFRMDTRNGGSYWGMVGRDPAWEKYYQNGSQGPPPTGFLRYSGGGNYAGTLVLLVAIWAAVQSLRRKDSVFSREHRRWLWFWLGIALVSLLLAFGRFAPFYRLVYALPYFSTIRNPVKFLYLFSFALVVIFALGIDGLRRKYMAPTLTNAASRWIGWPGWWNKAARFEKYWVYGCGLVWLAGWIGWLVYASHRFELEQYLQAVRLDPSLIASTANFSIRQVRWFIITFFLAAGLMALIFSGALAGRRAGRGGLLLGLLLVADLSLANQPWIVYWNYQDKYASNPIVEFFRDRPYEHRVAIAPVDLPPQLMLLGKLYRGEWLQHQFPFYNVQSYDLVEMSRMPEDFSAFMKTALQTDSEIPLRCGSRAWQLTNTRYILAPADFDLFWSQQDYLAQNPLQLVSRFKIVPKPGIAAATRLEQLTAVPAPDGPFAVFEFMAALSRAKLYGRWQVNTNDAAVLEQLFSPTFDPGYSVFVADEIPADSASVSTNQTAGRVEFAGYAPKDIVLKADVTVPSVLLLNDHFDPNWSVTVDGKPEKLLRCNFLMRGVALAPGTHRVEFQFRQTSGLLYVSLAAMATGLITLGSLIISANQYRLPAPTFPARPRTAPPPAPSHSGRKPDFPKKTGPGRNAK